jgi:hypothetical protein
MPKELFPGTPPTCKGMGIMYGAGEETKRRAWANERTKMTLKASRGMSSRQAQTMRQETTTSGKVRTVRKTSTMGMQKGRWCPHGAQRRRRRRTGDANARHQGLRRF